MTFERRGPRNLTGVVIAICAALALIPIMLASREKPASHGRTAPACPPSQTVDAPPPITK